MRAAQNPLLQETTAQAAICAGIFVQFPQSRCRTASPFGSGSTVRNAWHVSTVVRSAASSTEPAQKAGGAILSAKSCSKTIKRRDRRKVHRMPSGFRRRMKTFPSCINGEDAELRFETKRAAQYERKNSPTCKNVPFKSTFPAFEFRSSFPCTRICYEL